MVWVEFIRDGGNCDGCCRGGEVGGEGVSNSVGGVWWRCWKS